ncbi:YbaB/EbfC DNA-binding family protein [Nonomuraea solani]|uniref:YbaB/EbfC DNA-binding family protein n=1 Tax=Nonomuraea solani TaxID=1144553 RepID=A0A1H6ESX2_9ACTN|nr:YbaB/EbfC family nucleoid-associated protein [Nonomuraea solani]SEH00958.1 YbaB/EbfC DNA-binding family protein [Nonomuraea solani]
MASEDDDLRGFGEAARGLVGATVGADGLLERVRIAPRALRLDSQELEEQVLAAVRAAQQDRLARAGEPAPADEVPPALAPDTMAKRLDEFEAEALGRFSQMNASLDELLRRLEGP